MATDTPQMFVIWNRLGALRFARVKEVTVSNTEELAILRARYPDARR